MTLGDMALGSVSLSMAAVNFVFSIRHAIDYIRKPWGASPVWILFYALATVFQILVAIQVLV